MRPLLSIVACLLLALGAVEGTAYWWMHPAPAGLDQPVLVYRPGSGDQRSEMADENGSPVQYPPSPITDHRSSSPSTLNSHPSTSPATLTPLREVYNQAAPMLRCSSGQVFHAQIAETLGLHLAFFEWNDTDTGSVLEAFRHMPEACMGSIGMTLVSKEMPIHYRIGNESLVFDHTIFREAGGGAALAPPVHAFRAVWVAGMVDPNARQGIGGDEFDHLRTIRLKSALTRFRPTHARVIQGAVRGASNGDVAWQSFKSVMLNDLAFASSN